MDSRGTRGVRSAQVKSTMARPRMTPRKSGRSPEIWFEVSMAEAVAPPTRTRGLVSRSIPGATARMSRTSVAVADALGPLRGTTATTATGGFAESVDVVRTSDRRASAASIRATVRLAFYASISATTSNGPLKPAPKLSVMSEEASWELGVGRSALVGKPETEVEGREREEDEYCDDGDRQGHSAPHDERSPPLARGQCRGGSVGPRGAAGAPRGKNLVPGEAEHRREQGE